MGSKRELLTHTHTHKLSSMSLGIGKLTTHLDQMIEPRDSSPGSPPSLAISY